MAIQDFIGGGYIGKLGATIGQRYYGKYYTRTYTKPRDPKSPAQLAHRAQFSQAIHLAQEALNINRGAAYWQRPDMPEFSWRVSTAQRRLSAGMPPEQAIPIYPDSYTPDIILPPPTISWDDKEYDHVILSWPAITGLADRTLEFTIKIWVRYTAVWAIIKQTITIPSSGIISLILPWCGAQSYPDGAWIEAISTDDAQPQKPSIKLNRQSITQPEKPDIKIDPPLTVIEWSEEKKAAIIGSYLPFADLSGEYEYDAQSIDPATGKKTNYTRTVKINKGIVEKTTLPWDKTHQYDGMTILFMPNKYYQGQNIEINEKEKDIDQPRAPP